jgi:hypothetical protein
MNMHERMEVRRLLILTLKYLNMSTLFHIHDAITPEKEPPVRIVWEAASAPELVCRLRSKEKLLAERGSIPGLAARSTSL